MSAREFYTVNRLQARSLEPLPGSSRTIPISGIKGWNKGARFYMRDCVLGQAYEWVNVGDTTGCLFVPVGPVNGYGVAYAGYRAATTGSATQNFTVDEINAADIALAEFAVTDDNDQIAAVIANDGKVLLTLSADPLAAHGLNWLVLRNRCVPSHDIFAAGTVATVGGAAAEAFTVTGAQAGDIALVTYSATDDTDVITKAVVTANTLTVTFSANPLAAHGIHYIILRPRGSFKPSHYVAYAGNFTCITGSATQTITVTGVAATDVLCVRYRTTDDTDALLRAVATANTITLLLGADPLAAHSVAYMVLRAY